MMANKLHNEGNVHYNLRPHRDKNYTTSSSDEDEDSSPSSSPSLASSKGPGPPQPYSPVSQPQSPEKSDQRSASGQLDEGKKMETDSYYNSSVGSMPAPPPYSQSMQNACTYQQLRSRRASEPQQMESTARSQTSGQRNVLKTSISDPYDPYSHSSAAAPVNQSMDVSRYQGPNQGGYIPQGATLSHEYEKKYTADYSHMRDQHFIPHQSDGNVQGSFPKSEDYAGYTHGMSSANLKLEPFGTGAKTMSMWAKTQLLPQDALRQVQTTYSSIHFPIEVRHYCADWIESQPWKEIDENNTGHEMYAVQLLEALIKLLSDKAVEGGVDFILSLKLQEIAGQFRELYANTPMNLVRVVKSCLSMEEKLIQQNESPYQGGTDMKTQKNKVVNQEIQKQIEVLRQLTEVTEDDLKTMQTKQEHFVIQYQTQLKINGQLNQVQAQPVTPQKTELEKKLKQQKEEMERALLASAQELLNLRVQLAAKHQETITGLEQLQKKVVDSELISWKRRQQLHGNGAQFDTNQLETLQSWCESLAELIWKNRCQIMKVDLQRQQLPIDFPTDIKDIQPELNAMITGLLSSLVTSTFIVENQPPQVLKKDSRFSATVRLLVGGKLNIHMTPPQVKATIISEAQARGLLKNDTTAKDENSGDILNHNGTMEYHQATGQLSVTFRNMQLKKIKRADRKGTEVHTVAEEKFCILFQSDFSVGGNELVFQVWTLSLPVVVTVHGNQECNAMATVLWDNQFSEPGRTPFHVPDQVPWPELAEMLNTKFCSMAGRELSQDNLNYLASKLFGGGANEDYSHRQAGWVQFNKESLSARNFTFWEWFYSVMKLTREHLRQQWQDGSIIGFISKDQSQKQLLSKPDGTFLLRFSDSEAGGITIAWVASDPKGERQVWNLAPFTIKDFTIRSLSDRIRDLNTLVTLYPDIPKQEAFGKYYTQLGETSPPVSTDGYIKPQLINTIPFLSPPTAAVMNYDNPQTPQGMSQYGAPESPYSSSSMTPKPNISEMDSIDEEGAEAPDITDILTDYTQDDFAFEQINVNELIGRLGNS